MNPQEDDKLRQLWLSSRQEAPAGFSDYIMASLPQPQPLSEALKRPLLSPQIAGLLLALLVIGIGMVMLFGGTATASPAPAPGWVQALQQLMGSGQALLLSSSGLLPGLAGLSVGVIVLTALDRLLKRRLQPQP
jgi:hypothetical protein